MQQQFIQPQFQMVHMQPQPFVQAWGPGMVGGPPMQQQMMGGVPPGQNMEPQPPGEANPPLPPDPPPGEGEDIGDVSQVYLSIT